MRAYERNMQRSQQLLEEREKEYTAEHSFTPQLCDTGPAVAEPSRYKVATNEEESFFIDAFSQDRASKEAKKERSNKKQK